MCSGSVTSLAEFKACSGKCKGSGGCGALPRIWVVAACAGMIALFEKQQNGQLALHPQEGKAVAASPDDFAHHLTRAASSRQFDQLLLVGSANDISWMRHTLPPEAAHSVTAEIEYPLVAGWFAQAEAGQLSHALEHVLAG